MEHMKFGDFIWLYIYFIILSIIGGALLHQTKIYQNQGKLLKAWLLVALGALIMAVHWTWPFLLRE